MQNPIGEADLEWILHRNCEGTEQLRKIIDYLQLFRAILIMESCTVNETEVKEMAANKYAGTQTEKNLQEAFAGESQARNKYTYFSSVARKEGY